MPDEPTPIWHSHWSEPDMCYLIVTTHGAIWRRCETFEQAVCCLAGTNISPRNWEYAIECKRIYERARRQDAMYRNAQRRKGPHHES